MLSFSISALPSVLRWLATVYGAVQVPDVLRRSADKAGFSLSGFRNFLIFSSLVPSFGACRQAEGMLLGSVRRSNPSIDELVYHVNKGMPVYFAPARVEPLLPDLFDGPLKRR